MKNKKVLILSIVLATLFSGTLFCVHLFAQPATLYWGSKGSDVIKLQTRLKDWGYFKGPVDGVFGAATSRAVKNFQRKHGLTPDGVVGPATWRALGISAFSRGSNYTPSRGVSNRDEITLLARVINAEAGAEPYEGKVAVGAVILNRVESPSFPNTLAGVIYQPGAFESVSNGTINKPPSKESLRAAQDAMNGWDPVYGALYFWNPGKPVNKWIWSRKIIQRIGDHVFAR
ncbi:spore cortex-lytic protein [Thermincola ferriacetica]|uniref:Spore cortex-lytic enzyme n=2 Tax=Thermincola TaxID=278993 RepID=D5XDM4_THEPJ|nr:MULTISPECIES: spore cortex-lytic enzyme [Thermincola]ADG83770.1 spore cortex-lytic enzyme [Thermincola potens JR]KNZ69766.1 spore cortex-lytic protein [Thermincola ferriacetica]